jgi:ABC-2 type transport system permease protein
MLKIAFKDLRLFLKDKRGVMLTFLIPMVLISIFSLAFGGGDGEDIRPLQLTVADEDNSPKSKTLIDALDSQSTIEIIDTTLETGMEWVKKGKQSAVLFIPKGFSDSIKNGAYPVLDLRYDKMKEVELGLLQQAIMPTFMKEFGSSMMISQQGSFIRNQFPQLDSSTLKLISRQMSTQLSPGQETSARIVTLSPVNGDEKSNVGIIHAVAGTAVMMLMFSVASLGASMLDEKNEGTLKRLLYSPLAPTSLLFGKVISTILVSIAQLLVMFTFSCMVFGLQIEGHLPGLLIMVLATAFAVTSFGIFLASVAKTRAQVQGLATLIVLAMSAIGGSMIPLFVMPEWMQNIGVVSINYWSIQGFYDVFWRRLSITDPDFLLRPIVLMCIGTTLSLLAVYFFKRNVLKA